MGYTEDVNMEPPGEFLYSLGGMDCDCERSEAISGDCFVVITPRNDDFAMAFTIKTTLKDLYGFLISPRRLERS